MAITPTDFEKIWSSNASTPAYTFSDADYLEGWDFVGNLPPTRAQWNAIQKRTDEKMKYVFDNFGAPLIANTVAEMTLQNRVYVYMGSEVGYTAGDWYYWDGNAWTDGGVYNAIAVQTDATLTQAGVPADAKATGEILNNTVNGGVFEWELGTLTPGTGAEQTGTTRIRSKYIAVTPGTKITLVAPTSRLLVYCFDSSKGYVSDSPWLGTNKFTVTNTSVRYVRILIRKDTSNSTISSAEIETLAQGLTISYALPIETYTEVYEIPKHAEALSGNRYIDVEVGSMSAGTPFPSTAYVRSRDFVFANKGDVFTVSPVGFGLYYGVIYLYTTDNAQGYTSSVTIPTVTTGKTWSYIFTQDCFFKFRGSNASGGAYITPADLVNFNKTFHIDHMYSADELIDKIKPFDIDYDTINTSIQGNFNLAIQTDTHMSKFVGYTTAQYDADNFDELWSVVKTVNNLHIDVFANLGDFIRGYQCDPDYESRANADTMLDAYKEIKTYKAFVIGNHDDGNLFYHDSTYNDKQSIQQVMFPSEQFNRYTKFGLNNKGVSNYYYEDINGVRIITLYQRDFDYSDGIPGIESFKIGTQQISWLTNTALNTNLPVIILTHAPLLSTLYATSRVGFDDVLSALTTFISNGGTVIAVLSGHTHAQNTAKVNGINHVVFKNGYKQFELVSVDLVNRTISCKAYNGSTADLSLTF